MSLEFPENAVLASRYVKQALPIMIKNNIVPNPCNFALWYAYVANRDFELKDTLNMQSRGESHDPLETNEIDDVIAPEDENDPGPDAAIYQIVSQDPDLLFDPEVQDVLRSMMGFGDGNVSQKEELDVMRVSIDKLK